MTDSLKSLALTRGEIKDFFFSLRDCFVQYYKDFFVKAKEIDKKDFIGNLFSVLCINIALAFFCFLREGTGDLYMSVFIPAFFANALVVFYGSVNKSPKIYPLLTSFLITTGFALQIFMLDPESEGVSSTVNQYVIFAFIGIILSMIAMPVLAFITSENTDTKVLRFFVVGATIALYGILLVFAKEVNGAKSWLFIGSVSIQVTEITKILAGIYFVLCLVDKNMPEKVKGIRTFIALVLHAGFLAIIGEFGTLGMIAIVYFILKAFFIKNKKQLLCEVLVLVIAFLMVLGVSFGIYITTPVEKSEKQSAEQTVEQVVETVEDASDAETADKAEEKVGFAAVFDKLLSELGEIYNKFGERMYSFIGEEYFESQIDMFRSLKTMFGSLKIEKKLDGTQYQEIIALIDAYDKVRDEAEERRIAADEEEYNEEDERKIAVAEKALLEEFGYQGATYQIDSAKNALLYVEWFGTEKGSFGFVPEIKSDFVFIYLIVRWGVVGALLVLVALLFLFAETIIAAAKSKKLRESALSICFISLIVIQSLLCICSNLGLFPVVGLPFAFLSDGGSAMCVNLMMSFFIMHFLREEQPLPIESEVSDNV